MGGTFGGAIDPAFTQSSMEIDYVSLSISKYLRRLKGRVFYRPFNFNNLEKRYMKNSLRFMLPIITASLWWVGR
jgi:hypothetical protein